ncbi:HERV-H LTR-associating protein 2 [Carlito syrichta]|uniref:HERV-H LTR-associating protein 2 n=1 Tax=Carlito syrichta TaxID=1868482 RepID=A0A3Q0DG60_CARSF|nr:HERV-H LTR-associating protein 2 [Carlito syrichta]
MVVMTEEEDIACGWLGQSQKQRVRLRMLLGMRKVGKEGKDFALDPDALGLALAIPLALFSCLLQPLPVRKEDRRCLLLEALTLWNSIKFKAAHECVPEHRKLLQVPACERLPGIRYQRYPVTFISRAWQQQQAATIKLAVDITNMTSTRHESTSNIVFLPHSHTVLEWISRRLSLLDEGIYTCYVGTAAKNIINKVVLKVGAFLMPMIKYEKKNTNYFLLCSVSSVYPHPIIKWKMDNTSIPESDMEETESLGPFSISSTLNITELNSSYECAVENSLLKQTWTGHWTMQDDLRKKQNENILLSCQLVKEYFLPDQDFKVTWSRVENGKSSLLAYYLSSSQNTTINESRFSWNNELINQRDFSMTLTHLSLSDSGQYLCNISSSKSTLLTIHTLHVEQNQNTNYWYLLFLLLVLFLAVVIICKRCCNRSTERPCTDERASDADNAEENVPLSEYPASTKNPRQHRANTKNHP